MKRISAEICRSLGIVLLTLAFCLVSVEFWWINIAFIFSGLFFIFIGIKLITDEEQEVRYYSEEQIEEIKLWNDTYIQTILLGEDKQ